MTGACRSGGLAGCWRWTRRVITTDPVAPTRPTSRPASRRSARRGRATVIAGRVCVLLQREGLRINIKKTQKIYNALGLQLRNETPNRRVRAKLREDRCEATRPNET